MPSSRKKSCTHCRLAKTRCSLDLPRCTRCRGKDLVCHYQNTLLDHSGSKGKSSEAVQSGGGTELIPRRFERSDDFETIIAANEKDAALALNPFQGNGLAYSNTPHTNLSRTEDTEIDSIGFLNPMTVDLNMDLIGTQRHVEQKTSSAFDLDLPPLLDFFSVQDVSAVLAPKPLVSTASWLIARMLIGCISSYPYMLRECSSLPPFIHSQFMYDEGKRDGLNENRRSYLPQALSSCSNIVQMYRTASADDNRVFVERTIFFEQQRLFDECRSYGPWDALHALQACTIYLILIAFQSVDKHKHGDLHAYYPPLAPALMSTITCLISLHHSNDRVGDQNLANADAQSSWHRWIWEESAKRATGLLFIIGLLVNLSAGQKLSPPCPGFGAVCLPAVESTWEAPTQLDWEERLVSSRTTRRSNTVLTVSHLEDMICWKKQVTSNVILSDLGNWCEAADRFGRLVVMAVTMNNG